MTKIHLAKAGTYSDASGRSVTLSAEQIAELAASYPARTAKAPLVLGHPKTDDPAHGWIDGLEVDAKGDLWGVTSDVTPDLAAAVKAGRYRNVSISYWPKGHKSSPNPDATTLRHVGVLGAAVPAIPGLTPISFAASDPGVVTVEMSAQRWGWQSAKTLLHGLRDWLIEREGKEAADSVMPTYLLDDLDSAADAERDAEPKFSNQSPEAAMPKDDTNPKPVDLAARTAELDAREAELKAREEANAIADAEARAAASTSFAAGLVKEGKLAPAGSEVVADIHRRLAVSDEPVAFANGTKAPALAEFEKLFTGAVPIVNLSAASEPDQSSDETQGKDTASLTARARQIVKDDDSISFSAAVRQAEEEAGKA